MTAETNAIANGPTGESREFGVLYLVDENPAFRKMLDISIASLKRFHPDWPIHVVEIPSFKISLPRKIYRAVSFWKNQARRDRAGQDVRVIASKSQAMINSPFDLTFYVDVDTVFMRPLDDLLEKARQADVLMTPLPWKKFERREPWQPETWPYWMAGVAFFSAKLKELYRQYFEDRFGGNIDDLPLTDQFVLSLILEMEKDQLRIVEAPDLQMDVLNIPWHFGTKDVPMIGDCLDLRYERLQEFRIFHYNEFKPRYMEQIRDVWGME